MEIAKGITTNDYLKLNLINYKNPDWETAFSYLDKRLSERYLDPIQVLLDYEADKFASEKNFGFSILAIDFLLIETIQSFYEGVINSHGQSKNLFKNFLTQRDNFKSFFLTRDEAGDFYINFRCGILHQAQTFRETKVWSVGSLISRQGKYLKVNRNLFHEAVKKEKNIYIEKLFNRESETILKNFKIKMDFIAAS